jgi:quercetin dioxygenase-like cupin family protein
MRIPRIVFASFFLLLGCPKTEQPPLNSNVNPPATAKESAPPNASTEPAAGPAPSEQMRGVEASALEWKDIPDANGAKMAPVWQNPKTGASAFFVRFPAGWSHPNHFHPTDFHRVIVEGEMEVTMKDGTKIAGNKGDYLRYGANVIHRSSTKGGATIFIVADGKFGSITVGDDGKPKKATDPAAGPVTAKPLGITADKMNWKDFPGAEGVRAAVLFKNPDTGSTAMLVKYKPNFKAGRHFHKSSFHRIQIEGDLTIVVDGKSLEGKAGDYFRGVKDVVHDGQSKSGGTMFIVSDAEWGTVFVDKDGKALPVDG